MKHIDHIRIILIPGYLDNLSEYKKTGWGIPDFEELNVASNLNCLIENRSFKDDSQIKKEIIDYFKNLNFLHPVIQDIKIFTLDILCSFPDWNRNFITFCEVETIVEDEFYFIKDEFGMDIKRIKPLLLDIIK